MGVPDLYCTARDRGSPMEGARVLIVDDDRELVDLLAFSVRRAGLEPLPAHDRASATQAFEMDRPEVVVLDVNLGRSTGLDVLRDIRRTSLVPVILLTAMGSEDDKVRGLELGADDYVTKPFSHRELIARIRVQLRRDLRAPGSQTPDRGGNDEITAGPITLSVQQHVVSHQGRELPLSITEFRLLHYLMLHAGSVVPTGMLLRHVWGYNDASSNDVVRVTVSRLRRKLGDEAAEQHLIRTVAGVGVMFTAPRDPRASVVPEPGRDRP